MTIRSAVKITVKLDGLKQFKKFLTAEGYVKVGILGDKAQTPHAGTDKTNAQIGVVHEFGRKNNQKPHARSFIRYPIEHKSKQILQELSAQKEKIEALFATGDPIVFYKMLGLAAEKAIIEAFETGGFGSWEKLDPKTIARRPNKSDTILVNEGQLKGSISSQAVKE
jgi:hypothetical protein